MPFWLLTLGQYLALGEDLVIPYTNLMISLATLIFPLGLGSLLTYKKPALGEKLGGWVKPAVFIMMLIMTPVSRSLKYQKIRLIISWVL